MSEARPLSEWTVEHGDVLWWKFPIVEPPYVGSPLDLGQVVETELRTNHNSSKTALMVGGWPGYHTHWTPLPPIPSPPKESSHDV